MGAVFTEEEAIECDQKSTGGIFHLRKMTTWRDESRFNAEGAERFDWLAKWSFGRNFFSTIKRGFSQLGTRQKTVRNGLMITVLVIPCMGTHCCWDYYKSQNYLRHEHPNYASTWGRGFYGELQRRLRQQQEVGPGGPI